ncbi:MAG TPA: dihydropteroate synthase, partial [Sphingopyxis sp.]|nr:dihydropteroate synthase [Sphingopyxis sp.]
QRLGGTVALHYQAATQGAQLLRVHDIAENRQALRVWRGLRDAALTA